MTYNGYHRNKNFNKNFVIEVCFVIGFDMNLREEYIKNLCEKYSFIEQGIFGKSLCNRPLNYLKIGSEHHPVLFAAAFHGMEWLTSLLVLKFTNSICDAIYNKKEINGVDVGSFLKKRGLVIIPCVNPDGVEISLYGPKTAGDYESLVNEVAGDGNTTFWQANARGVDLNHNFNASWENLHRMEAENGITQAAATRFGGSAPESEPETKSLVDFCRKCNFRHAVAFHSQGEEIYWNFGENTPKESERMAKNMAKLSGYKFSEPEGLAVGGGFKDWFIEEFSRPGFTVEIGKGQNPLPLGDVEEIYRKLKNMLIYCTIAN